MRSQLIPVNEAKENGFFLKPSKKKFCEFFNIDISISIDQIKTYIETNVKDMLNKYFDRTFDCPILYYNQKIIRRLGEQFYIKRGFLC